MKKKRKNGLADWVVEAMAVYTCGVLIWLIWILI